MVQIGHGVALTLVWPCGVWPWSYDTVGWLVGWLIGVHLALLTSLHIS